MSVFVCGDNPAKPIQSQYFGVKHDKGKNRLGLVLGGFARALQEVGRVGTSGAKIYGDNNWIELTDGEERYYDAMFRHVLKEAAGQKLDVDSGMYHAAHIAWNALARLDLMLRRKEQEGRRCQT